MQLPVLLENVRACQTCAAVLPIGPRPLVQISSTARILIIGQAPGRAAHESGIPWNDKSGDRLRAWLGIDRDMFYNESKVALMPMGFCFPGTGKSGDLAPRPECAPQWNGPLLEHMKAVRLTVYVGGHEFSQYMGTAHPTLTDAVRHGVNSSGLICLPHPSPRNNLWLAKNRWFEADVLPVLLKRTREALER